MDTQGIFRKFGTKKKRDSLPLSKPLPRRTENKIESAPAVLEASPVVSIDLNRPLPPAVPSKPLPQTSEITLSEPGWIPSHHRSSSSSNQNGPSPWEESEIARLKASHDKHVRDLRVELGMELEDTRRDMAMRTHQLAELASLHERDKEAIERVKDLEKEGEKMKEELNNLKSNAKQNFQIAEEWKKAHDELTQEKEKRVEELTEARQQIATLERDIEMLRNEKEQLMGRVQAMKMQFQQAMEEKETRFAKNRQILMEQSDAELYNLHMKMDAMKNKLKADHEMEKMGLKQQVALVRAEQQQQEDKHQVDLQRRTDELMATFQARMNEADAKMAALATERDRQAAAERDQFARRIADLERVLMEKPGDFDLRLVSDGSLREEYRSLKRSVDTITFNLGPITIDRNIDATSFLEREGKGQERLFVKALVWAMILDGFFSVPYGFGALGPGNQGGPLFDLYRSWKTMLEGEGDGEQDAKSDETGPRGPLEQHEFGPFYRDRYANSWRSATFQSILSAATARDADGNIAVTTGIAKVVHNNRQRVQDNTLAMLKSVCSNHVSEEIQEELAAAMLRASELSIIFGAHRANVCFGIPKRGDAVEIGREFVDCQDGDVNRVTTKTVELPVLPALFTIGDGKNDLTSVFCVEQGEILPVGH